MITTKKLLLSLTVLAALSQSPAWAHAALEGAMPAKNAELADAPKDVTLQFNEELEPAFSSIKVLDVDGNDVLIQKAVVDAKNATVLHVPVTTLKPGKYTVQWAAVGHDGHRRHGDYVFSVR
jgi:methionine-rich copper-binding protein CopC